MLFCNIDLLDQNFDVHKDMFVGVKGGRIDFVGPEDPTMTDFSIDYGQRYNGFGKLLAPGFYNSHTHAPMTLLRGYAENLPLHRWLNEMVFPFEAKINDETAYPATQLAIAEMLRFGTVSFTDMYYFSDARAQAITETGIKCNMCEGLIVFDERSYDQLPTKAINDHLIRDYHNTADERLKIDLCIHAEYTTTPKVVQAVGQAAVDLGVRTHIHLSETRSEHEECKGRHSGMSPAQYFESLGFFRQPCTAAHCVWTEPGDWEIFTRNDVTVASCPVSNMKLASGFAPVPQMLDAGVRVALGTDGVASNNNHNLMQDLYLFGLLFKGVTHDPTVITPAQALAAATINGAVAQGRMDSGSIRKGNRADLIVLDTAAPWMTPTTDVACNVVFAAQGSDVCLTMVDGKVLYENGEYKTLDVEKALYETQRATDSIMASL